MVSALFRTESSSRERFASLNLIENKYISTLMGKYGKIQ